MQFFIRIGSYTGKNHFFYFKRFCLRPCLAKSYFYSKQNCQNMPKDVFAKHALKLKFIFIKTIANQTKP